MVLRTTKSHMGNVSKCDKREYETLSSGLVSYQQYFLDLSVKRDSCFTDFTKEKIAAIDKCWSQCERKWHALHSQVRLLGDLLDNNDGVNHIMNDFDALESWLDEQEKVVSTTSCIDILGSAATVDGEKDLDQAISHQNNLEDFLKLQNEKLYSACQKVDSFQSKSTLFRGENKTNPAHENGFVQKNENIEKVPEEANDLLDSKDSKLCDVSENEKDSGNNNNNNNNNNVKQTKKLVGLLKKDRPPSEPKKRVIFSTTHEFSDCYTIQHFSQLNDEYEDEQHNNDNVYDFYDQDPDFYDQDGDFDADDADDIVFSEDASYFPKPPQGFLQLSDSDGEGRNFY